MKKLFLSGVAALIAIMLLTFSCTKKESKPVEKSTATVADTINNLMAGITRHAEQLNTDSLFALLSTDSSSLYMSGGMYYNYHGLKSAFNNFYKKFKSQKISTVHSEVIVPGPGSAIWISYAKSICVTKEDKAMEDFLCETWVWQRKPEGWKVVHYHESVMKMPTQEMKASVEAALGQLSTELGSKSLQPREMKPILTAFLKKFPSIYGSTLAFVPTESEGKKHFAAPYYYWDGNEIKEVELQDSYDYTRSDWYAKPVKEGKGVWCDPYYDDGGGGVVMITYSIPLYNKDKQLMGVLTSDLKL